MNDFDEDSQPCPCCCGEWFDLPDGNPCGSCKTLFCENCVDEPFDRCPGCKQGVANV